MTFKSQLLHRVSPHQVATDTSIVYQLVVFQLKSVIEVFEV